MSAHVQQNAFSSVQPVRLCKGLEDVGKRIKWWLILK